MKRVEVAHDVPPRAVAAGVASDFEQVVVLVLNLGRVNAEAVENGGLQELLRLIAPLRQHHQQRGQHEQPHHVQHERLAGEAVDDREGSSRR